MALKPSRSVASRSRIGVEADPGRAVTAVVGDVARGLIGDEIDGDVVGVEVLEQIDDVAVVGDRQGLAGCGGIEHPPDRGGEVVGDLRDPALGVTGLDARGVDLGDDPGAAGDLQRLGLGAGHPAEPRGDEGVAGEVAVLGHPEVEPAGVEQGDVGAVDDALGADVHPAAGGHLTVVDAAQGGEPVEVLRGVEHPDHEAVGDDGAGRFGARGEEPERVARTDDEGLSVDP